MFLRILEFYEKLWKIANNHRIFEKWFGKYLENL